MKKSDFKEITEKTIDEQCEDLNSIVFEKPTENPVKKKEEKDLDNANFEAQEEIIQQLGYALEDAKETIKAYELDNSELQEINVQFAQNIFKITRGLKELKRVNKIIKWGASLIGAATLLMLLLK